MTTDPDGRFFTVLTFTVQSLWARATALPLARNASEVIRQHTSSIHCVGCGYVRVSVNTLALASVFGVK